MSLPGEYRKVSEKDNKKGSYVKKAAVYEHESSHPRIVISKVGGEYKATIPAMPPHYRQEYIISHIGEQPTRFEDARQRVMDFMREYPDGGRWAEAMRERRY